MAWTDLQRLIAAWPTLPEDVRAGIMAAVHEAGVGWEGTDTNREDD